MLKRLSPHLLTQARAMLPLNSVASLALLALSSGREDLSMGEDYFTVLLYHTAVASAAASCGLMLRFGYCMADLPDAAGTLAQPGGVFILYGVGGKYRSVMVGHAVRAARVVDPFDRASSPGLKGSEDLDSTTKVRVSPSTVPNSDDRALISKHVEALSSITPLAYDMMAFTCILACEAAARGDVAGVVKILPPGFYIRAGIRPGGLGSKYHSWVQSLFAVGRKMPIRQGMRDIREADPHHLFSHAAAVYTLLGSPLRCERLTGDTQLLNAEAEKLITTMSTSLRADPIHGLPKQLGKNVFAALVRALRESLLHHGLSAEDRELTEELEAHPKKIVRAAAFQVMCIQRRRRNRNTGEYEDAVDSQRFARALALPTVRSCVARYKAALYKPHLEPEAEPLQPEGNTWKTFARYLEGAPFNALYMRWYLLQEREEWLDELPPRARPPNELDPRLYSIPGDDPNEEAFEQQGDEEGNVVDADDDDEDDDGFFDDFDDEGEADAAAAPSSRGSPSPAVESRLYPKLFGLTPGAKVGLRHLSFGAIAVHDIFDKRLMGEVFVAPESPNVAAYGSIVTSDGYSVCYPYEKRPSVHKPHGPPPAPRRKTGRRRKSVASAPPSEGDGSDSPPPGRGRGWRVPRQLPRAWRLPRRLHRELPRAWRLAQQLARAWRLPRQLARAWRLARRLHRELPRARRLHRELPRAWRVPRQLPRAWRVPRQLARAWRVPRQLGRTRSRAPRPPRRPRPPRPTCPPAPPLPPGVAGGPPSPQGHCPRHGPARRLPGDRV